MTSTPDPLRAHEQALLAFARYMLDPERANPATTDMAEVGKLAGFVINGLPAVRAALAQTAPALDAPNPQKCDCRGAGSLYRNEHAFGCHMFAALGDPA